MDESWLGCDDGQNMVEWLQILDMVNTAQILSEAKYLYCESEYKWRLVITRRVERLSQISIICNDLGMW